METALAAPRTSMVQVLLLLWRTLYGSTNGAWRAPRRVLWRRNTYQAVATSLKMNVDGAASRDAVKDRSIPMWTLSRDAKSVTSVHSAGEGGEEFSPLTAGENRTLVRLMRLSSPHSRHCESPTGPTVELRPKVHRHGT